jgi:hypothetical protein
MRSAPVLPFMSVQQVGCGVVDLMSASGIVAQTACRTACNGARIGAHARRRQSLAAFCDEYPSLHGVKVIPEKEFEPHVAAGRILKREDITPPAPDAPIVGGPRIGLRRVLYALPEQAWRIEAYPLLWKTAEKCGWNAGFERMEGSLLGYEDWQNDVHIERRYSSQSRDPRHHRKKTQRPAAAAARSASGRGG